MEKAEKITERFHGPMFKPRIEAVVGLFVTGIAVFLGAAWPSLLTLIALPLIPAPFMCLWYLIDPAAFERRRYARAYLLAASCLGGASILFEVWWLSTRAEVYFGYGIGPPGQSFGASGASSVRVDVDIKSGINFNN